MTIIGISGYARAGKDTLGALLADRGFEIRSFAAPMRLAARAIDPIVGVWPNGDIAHYVDAVESLGYDGAKVVFPELRRFLQRLGTEYGRQILGENFWVDQALGRVGRSPIAITDVRFRNEAQAILDRGGIVVRVVRPGVGPANEHPSERDLDHWPFDRIIHNAGAVEDLADEADNLAWLAA